MAGIPRKRTAIVKTKSGPYKKLTQIKGDGRWIPTALAAVTTSPALASTPKSHRPLRYGGYDRRLKEFSFRITRDDGRVATQFMFRDSIELEEDSGIQGGYIDVYRKNPKWFEGSEEEALVERVALARGMTPSNQSYWELKGNTWYYKNGSAKWSYNTETQIWTLPFYSDVPKTGSRKYWANFRYMQDSVDCQYSESSSRKYVYKTDTFYNEDNYISPKFYEAKVPIFTTEFSSTSGSWEHTGFVDPAPWFFSYNAWCSGFVTSYLTEHPYIKFGTILWPGEFFTLNDTFFKQYTVKSSIPYEVTEWGKTMGMGVYGYEPRSIRAYGCIYEPPNSNYGFMDVAAHFSGDVLDVTYNTWDELSSTREEFTVNLAGYSETTHRVTMTLTPLNTRSHLHEDYEVHTIPTLADYFVNFSVYRESFMEKFFVGISLIME